MDRRPRRPTMEHDTRCSTGCSVWAMSSPADIVFSTGGLVQPDIFVVPPQVGSKPLGWADVTTA